MQIIITINILRKGSQYFDCFIKTHNDNRYFYGKVLATKYLNSFDERSTIQNIKATMLRTKNTKGFDVLSFYPIEKEDVIHSSKFIVFKELFDKQTGFTFYGRISGVIDKDIFHSLCLFHYDHHNVDDFSFEERFRGFISSLEKEQIKEILENNGYKFSLVR